MRKYRGKRKDNGKWVYGSFVQVVGKCYIVLAGATPLHHSPIPYIRLIEVIPETVGQFLCKDKKGNDIFAGTPIRYAGKDYPKGFLWDEGGLRWTLNDGYFHTHYGATGTGGEDDYFDLEIIGTVHDKEK